MNPALRLTIVTLTVGGGFTGFVVALQNLFGAASQSVADFSLMLMFLGLYAYVIVSGLLFVLDARRMTPLIVAFALQVPWLSSPLITFRFSAGVNLSVGLVGGSLQYGYSLGSVWNGSFGQSEPWGGGINFFALIMLALTLRARLSLPA